MERICEPCMRARVSFRFVQYTAMDDNEVTLEMATIDFRRIISIGA